MIITLSFFWCINVKIYAIGFFFILFVIILLLFIVYGGEMDVENLNELIDHLNIKENIKYTW